MPDEKNPKCEPPQSDAPTASGDISNELPQMDEFVQMSCQDESTARLHLSGLGRNRKNNRR